MRRLLGLVVVLAATALACSATEVVSEPTAEPTAEPTPEPTAEPTAEPTEAPTAEPTVEEGTTLEDVQPYAGEWTGTWENLTFGSTGDVTMTVEVEEEGIFTLVIDLGGNVFGAGDPPPITFTGNYQGEEPGFSTEAHPLFGDMRMVIDEAGNVTINADNLPSDRIASMTANGTLTTEAIDLTYDITFTDDTTANGIMNLTK